MTHRIRESVQRLRNDKALTKRIYQVTMAFAILLLVMAVKDISSRSTYISDSDGNIRGIERKSLKETEVFRLRLTVGKKSGNESRIVEINKTYLDSSEEVKKEDENALIDAEIAGIITDAELSGKKRIMLPRRLSDGTVLVWSRAEDNAEGFAVIALCYFFVAGALVFDKLRAPAAEGMQVRGEVLKGLPRFVNQLLLMMNSGLILSDSLKLICDSYRIIPEDERGYFEQKLIDTCTRYDGSRFSAASRINELASETRVKELVRIAAILYENEKRGCSVTDNLSRESSFLWEDRKIIAKERGKIIDTKMSYPLGILLILLIVITMAPAMLTM